MSWLEVSFNATDEAVDWVRTLLSTTDYISDIEVAEFEQEPTAIAADVSSPWAFTLRFYLPHDGYANTRIDKIESLLSPLSRTNLVSELDITIVDEKTAFQPTTSTRIHEVGQRFIITSSNAKDYPDTSDKIIIRLKKTLSFGSGLHPATMLSLKLLERFVAPGMHTLDLGSGSGILSVAIAKMGAQVLALDNDPIAVQATQAAILDNGVGSQAIAMKGSLGQGSQMGHWMGLEELESVPAIESAKKFDLIVANILGRMHLALVGDYANSLRQSDTQGLLITSGYTTDYEGEIDAALVETGFEAVDKERFNEWVAMAHRLKVQTAQV